MNSAIILNPCSTLSKNLKLKWKVILNFLWLATIGALLSLSVISVMQLSREMSEKYLIENGTKRINEILTENKKMEIVFMQDNSLNNIIGLVNGLNFEKVDKLHYIHIIEDKVVTKN